MAAVTLLFVSAVVNGASVAVDSKSGTEAAQPDTAQLDTDAAQSKKLEVEASVAEGHDSTDPRIGLYTQQIVNLESVGPIGANQAFYLTTSDGKPVFSYFGFASNGFSRIDSDLATANL